MSTRSAGGPTLPRARRAWALAALTLCACEPETIVAATDDSSAEDAAMGNGTACTRNEDCELTEYCALSGCGADEGRCVQRPVCVDARADPVCGCDGITYFNDCLREANGVALARTGRCDFDGLRCGGPPDAACPDDAYCVRIAPDERDCGRFVPGNCWVIPSSCGAEPPGGDRFTPCGAEPECLDLCNAITLDVPIARVGRCRF